MSDAPRKPPKANAARIALGTLTAVPAGASWEPEAAKRALGWYPAVGWLMGAMATSVPFIARAVGWRGKAAAIIGVIILGVLIAASRMMQFDAIADAADGLLGGSDPEERLAIMDDSGVGAFGATMVAFAVAAEGAALTGIVQTTAWYAIVIGSVLSLFGASIALWTIPPARTTGMVAPIAGRPAVTTVLVALAFVAALALLPFVRVGDEWTSISVGAMVFGGWPSYQVQGFFACLVVGTGAMAGFPRLLARPVNGITGDLVGASIALTMLLTLATGALFG
jgi:adenosylcobinamide-GDP ribazoletransferase